MAIASSRRPAPARYRVLAQAFAHAFAARFAEVPRARAAAALGVSVPTLRKLLRADATINEATVGRLERALGVGRLAFATEATAPGRPIIPAITALPAGQVDATLHALAGTPMLAAFFAQVGRHVHWRGHIADEARPYRQVLTGSPTAGYHRFVVEPAALPAELILSFSIRGLGTDVAIDYGALVAGGGRARSWAYITREGHEAALTRAAFSFLTWLGPGDEVIVRGDRPSAIRAAGVLARDDGERLLADEGEPIGFRAMGYFHLPPELPAVEALTGTRRTRAR